MEVTGALICVDVVPEIIEEACSKGLNLVISHHPMIFGSLKRLTGKSMTERCVELAIRKNVAVYSCHTNLDSAWNGVSMEMAKSIGLERITVLQPLRDALLKLVTFVPEANADDVRNALFSAGAGQIGDYDSCSYNLSGTGTFRGGEGTNPFVGKAGKLHIEKEVRIETILPSYKQQAVVQALIKAHPYEEVAYDLYPLVNQFTKAGMGAIGFLKKPVSGKVLLAKLKSVFGTGVIKHTEIQKDKYEKIAVCGGSGSGLLSEAIRQKADAFISADFKYHSFFEADKRILVADVGHFESEQFTMQIFYDILRKKMPNFVVRFSDINTNPIIYL
jgi:dinuclear metal center YbgI/SA1388 family protein